MINIRYCRRCEKPYDIGTNYEVCPECRGELIVEENIGERR